MQPKCIAAVNAAAAKGQTDGPIMIWRYCGSARTGLVISVSRKPVAEFGRKYRPCSTSSASAGSVHNGVRLFTTGMLRVE